VTKPIDAELLLVWALYARAVSHREPTELPAGTLRCVECAAETTDGLGWRAFLTVGDEDAEDEEQVAVYCSECAEREFGPVAAQS